MRKIWLHALPALVFSIGGGGGAGGPGWPRRSANRRHILGGSVTVTAAPAFVSFRLISKGVATSSSGVGVTTTWTGLSRLCKLNLYGYFSSAGAALSGGSPAVNIPTSAVLGQVATGSPSEYTPFTQSNPIGGASLLLVSRALHDRRKWLPRGYIEPGDQPGRLYHSYRQAPIRGHSTSRRKCCEPAERPVIPSYSASSVLIEAMPDTKFPRWSFCVPFMALKQHARK